jgi:hypothetical protein
VCLYVCTTIAVRPVGVKTRGSIGQSQSHSQTCQSQYSGLGWRSLPGPGPCCGRAGGEKLATDPVACTDSAELYGAPIAEEGELWYNPDLASTYEHIAKNGPEDFYSGTLAREIVETVRSAVNPKTGRGGMMEFEDIAVRSLVIRHSTIATTCRPRQIYLKFSKFEMSDWTQGYKAVKRAPTRVEFTNAQQETFEIFGMGMPSSGGVCLPALRQRSVLCLPADGSAGVQEPANGANGASDRRPRWR